MASCFVLEWFGEEHGRGKKVIRTAPNSFYPLDDVFCTQSHFIKPAHTLPSVSLSPSLLPIIANTITITSSAPALSTRLQQPQAQQMTLLAIYPNVE
jgi:hypothetical protein